MAKQLEDIRITPSENGGHTVRHGFKSQRTNSPRNGLTSHYVEPEEFVFGASEHGKMLGHVKKALGLSDKKEEADEKE
jgi:hypothetical protein